MGAPRKPQDHKQAGMSETTKAIKMQSANMLQKQFLDVAATKLILIKRELGESEPRMYRIEDIIKMTREEASAARVNSGFVYPEKEIQDILDEAVDKLTNVLLGD